MKLTIAALFALLLTLPFAIGRIDVPVPAYTAATSTIRTPSLPGTSDQWLEFGRAVAGAFAGALAAFGFNFCLQCLAMRRENLAAGNLALHTLSRQLSATLILGRGVQEHRNRVLAADANTPIWAQMQPNVFYFSEELKFNFESLSFLCSKGDASVLSRLAHAEELYFDLAALVPRHAETVAAIQERLAANNMLDQPWDHMEQVLPLDLRARATAFTEGILIRIARNPDDIATAITDLRTAMTKRFSRDKVVRVQTKPDVARLAHERLG